MSSLRRVPLLVWAALLLNLAGAAYGFSANRIHFWFPDWIFRALIDHTRWDFPRLSFILFQIPGLLFAKAWPYSERLFEVRNVLLNFTLSFHGVAGVIVCTFLLARRKQLFLLPIFLVAFGMLFQHTAMVAFSGALHGFTFFWIVFCWSISEGPTSKTSWLKTALYVFTFLAFYLAYPPFSLLGSLALAIATKKSGARLHHAMAMAGTVVSALYLLFLEHLPVNKTYGETWGAIFGLLEGDRYHLWFVVSGLGSLLGSYFLKGRKILLCVALGALSLYFWLQAIPPEDSRHLWLWVQYRNRILVYGISFLLALLMWGVASMGRRKKTNPFTEKYSWGLAVLMLTLGAANDIVCTRIYKNQIKRLASQTTAKNAHCSMTSLNLDDFGIFKEEYPFYSIFHPELFKGRILRHQTPGVGETRGLPYVEPQIDKICETADPRPLREILNAWTREGAP